MVLGLRIRSFQSAEAWSEIRPVWERILTVQSHTIFQNFDLNLLAGTFFAGREEPFIVCAEASYGVAIVPATIRHDGSFRLLGEELFDYRCFLHQGDPEVLRAALAALAQLGRPLEIVAVRETEAAALKDDLPLLEFCCAPSVLCRDTSADEFAVAHSRLGRNLRRLARLGFALHRYGGDYPGLVRFIYRKKAAQDQNSLFRDPARVEFMVNAAILLQDRFEIFTLEDEASIAAALVVLREERCRRFYTGWFAPQLEKHSPALSLIYEITRQSLAEGLDCDYMTGEQSYKLRLATDSVPLYRVQATAEQLAALGQQPAAELIQAA
jgi:CelD/BcsL family acetyltransferase involved in cellulose biosynthesis